jgi:hypothetical protein
MALERSYSTLPRVKAVRYISVAVNIMQVYDILKNGTFFQLIPLILHHCAS